MNGSEDMADDDSGESAKQSAKQQQQQPRQDDSPSASSASKVLQTILSHARPEPQSLDTFWNHVWQKACAVYRHPSPPSSSFLDDKHAPTASWSTTTTYSHHRHDPFTALMEQGPAILVELLDAVRPEPLPRGVDRPPDTITDDATTRPLLFRDLQVLTTTEQRDAYGGDDHVWSAFLDGCSVVVNHADAVVPWLAALCDDLQQQQHAFPHAYANTYLTPAGKVQTAPAHADDRDVLVIQVVGQKEWIVYETVPIPYPYPHEQVGKDGLAVPESVIQGPVLLQTVLGPGDVLYLPRGYVHQARSSASQPSFHVTIALATHDWTLAGLLTQQLIPQIIMRADDDDSSADTNNWRRALVPLPSSSSSAKPKDSDDDDALQQSLDQIFGRLQQQITAQTIRDTLHARWQVHNTRAAKTRQAVYDKYNNNNSQKSKSSLSTTAVVGYHAARHLTWDSTIRAATAQERESCRRRQQQQQGLHVREVVADAIAEIVTRLKQQQQQQHAGVVGVPVRDLTRLLVQTAPPAELCPLTLLAFAKVSVELGAFAVVYNHDTPSSMVVPSGGQV